MRAARNMGELEVAPELVIIAAAGDEVLEFAADAAANGAKALVVIPSDAEEDGAGSAGREQRLLEIVRGAGLRMVGPHSWGVLNTAQQISLNTTFTSASVRAGGLAIGRPRAARTGSGPAARGGDIRLGRAAQAGCGICGAARWPAARADGPGCAELLVPRVVCGRARSCGRTPRLALVRSGRSPAGHARNPGRPIASLPRARARGRLRRGKRRPGGA